MTTRVKAPTTLEQALTTSYLAEDLEVTGARRIEIWLDDRGIGFTVQLQINNGDKLEKVLDADGTCVIDTSPASVALLNIKSASGTPNAQIEVEV